MAPKTRAKSAKEGAKDPNLKQTIKFKLYVYKSGDDSKNTKRCSHCGASVRSKDTETALQDTTNPAANVSAAPLGSIDPRGSAKGPSPAVPSAWNARRRRTARSKRFFSQYMYTLRSELRTKDELEVADFLVTRVAAATVVQMKKDPNYSAPVQKVSRPNCNQTRLGRRS